MPEIWNRDIYVCVYFHITLLIFLPSPLKIIYVWVWWKDWSVFFLKRLMCSTQYVTFKWPLNLMCFNVTFPKKDVCSFLLLYAPYLHVLVLPECQCEVSRTEPVAIYLKQIITTPASLYPNSYPLGWGDENQIWSYTKRGPLSVRSPPHGPQHLHRKERWLFLLSGVTLET